MSATCHDNGDVGLASYQAVFDLLSTAVAAMAADGRILMANAGWLALGHSSGRVDIHVGANYLAARQQAARSGDPLAHQEWEGIQAVLQGVSPRFEFNFSLAPSAGLAGSKTSAPLQSLEWFALRVSPLTTPIAGVLLQVENVTRFSPSEPAPSPQLDSALQLAQQALRRSDARWLTFFRASPLGISITQAEDGRFIEVNDSLVNMFGHSREAMLASTTLELGIWVSPEEREGLIKLLMEEGKVQQFRARFRRKSGVIGTMQIASELFFLDGQLQVLGIFTDITANELQNEELRRAKEAADAANRAKSAFLSNMSHEIRTPMNAILGYAQLMQRDAGLPEPSRDKLQIINRSGQHLLALIEDVLEMSKIEAGRITVQSAAFNVRGLLGDLEVMFRLRTEAKNLELFVEADRAVPMYVVADQGKVRQILVNLLGNAVKFTDQGRVELRVSITWRQSQLLLIAAVADTGPGISPSSLPALFRPFAHSSAERKSYEGTGLGLAISREYARMMGGDITVESQLGRGSSFKLTLPVMEGESPDHGRLPPSRRVMGVQLGQTPMVVLLADDNGPNRNWLRQLLLAVGCQVLEAENGQEAIAAWEKWRPQLILMDLQMPVLDGFEATRRIKIQPEAQPTVIIALTATVQEESRRAILAAGAADLLGKPLEESRLFAKMEAHLGVRLIYEPVLSEAASGALLSPARRQDSLAKLPVALRAALHDAIANGDLGGFEKHLGRLAELDRDLARSLQPLADNYDYDQLLKLLS